MAHVERRDRGRWRARWTDSTGREHSKTLPRKIDAEQHLADIAVSMMKGTYTDPQLGKTRLEDWAWRWLETVRSALKPTTIASYESLLRSRVLPELGRSKLGDLRPSEVQAFVGRLDDAGLSPSRIRKCVIVLSLALDAAMRDGLIARNATKGVKLPPIPRREAAYLEPDVVDRLAASMPHPYETLVSLLGTLGLRFGEAAALQRQHVDLLRRRLLVEASVSEVGGKLVRTGTKTHATRSVPLPRGLLDDLVVVLEDVGTDPSSPLFTSPTGGPLRLSAFYHRVWRPGLERAGLPRVGLHVLRHSAAARLISAGATPKAVQAVLGHASAGFTLSVYGHVFEADLDGLADRLDLLSQNLRRPADGLAASDDRSRNVARGA